MPKIKVISIKLKSYVREFSPVFSLSEESEINETLFCNICKKNIKCNQKADIEKHINRVKHKNSIKESNIDLKITQQKFNEDLCDLMVSLNIAIKKI